MKMKMIALMLLLLWCGCESKSGQLDRTPPTKAVILSVNPEKPNFYRVKRLDNSIVEVIQKQAGFQVGDTILHKFINFERQ